MIPDPCHTVPEHWIHVCLDYAILLFLRGLWGIFGAHGGYNTMGIDHLLVAVLSIHV
jgi:hypothetical protein